MSCYESVLARYQTVQLQTLCPENGIIIDVRVEEIIDKRV